MGQDSNRYPGDLVEVAVFTGASAHEWHLGLVIKVTCAAKNGNDVEGLLVLALVRGRPTLVSQTAYWSRLRGRRRAPLPPTV